ncbi:MAG: IS1634 family transposase [Thermoplasmata archaeon]
MAIKRRRRGTRVYLEEWRSHREGKKVVSKFVRYLGPEGGPQQKGPGSILDRVQHHDSRRAGAVRLLWTLAEDLEFRETINRIGSRSSVPDSPSPGTHLTVWAINRVLDPESATQLGPWVATTDLPLLTGFPDEAFTKDDFLNALDTVCHDEPALAQVIDHTRDLDIALSARWRELHPLPQGEKEVVAYDLTNVLFFGVTCPIAEVGHNPDHQARPQVNVGVVVSRHDRTPLFHFAYRGNRNGGGSVRNLLVQLQSAKVPPGLLIVDRGIMGKRFVEEARGMGWHLLGGLSKASKEVRAILDTTEVPETPTSFVKRSKTGGIHAVKVRARLWDAPREVVIYTNADKAVADRVERNEALSRIGEALTTLAAKGAEWSEAKLHAAITEVVGDWKEFVQVRVKRGGATPRVAWEYRDREVKRAARQDGKYALVCTDERLSAAEVVRSYLGKDFVEKCFRTAKTFVELEPVRHRRERRVRAYLFVCMLALRLQTALRWRLMEGGVEEEKVAEYQERLLEDLGRVERTAVQLGGQARTWYLNVTSRVKEGLKRLKLPELLKETPVTPASPPV